MSGCHVQEREKVRFIFMFFMGTFHIIFHSKVRTSLLSYVSIGQIPMFQLGSRYLRDKFDKSVAELAVSRMVDQEDHLVFFPVQCLFALNTQKGITKG